jgi:hypothetical protein
MRDSESGVRWTRDSGTSRHKAGEPRELGELEDISRRKWRRLSSISAVCSIFRRAAVIGG